MNTSVEKSQQDYLTVEILLRLEFKSSTENKHGIQCPSCAKVPNYNVRRLHSFALHAPMVRLLDYT